MKTKRRKDGRLERLITLHDGITGEPFHKHIYATTTDELNRKAAKIKAEYDGLSYSRFTVGNFIEYYLAARKDNDRGTSTVSDYWAMYNNHIQNTKFAGMRLETVNVAACRQFLRDYQPLRGKGTRMKQMVYGFLKMAFKQAWKERLIKENPWDFVDKPVHHTAERMVLTPEEFQEILGQIGTIQMRRIMHFALNTGLRRSEVCGLQLQDLHLKEGYISVRNGVKRVGNKYKFGTPKNKASYRNVAIPGSIIALIREQLDDLPIHNRTDFLFQGMDGGHIAPNSVTRAFARARDALGYPKEMSLHSLRATVATYLAELDFNPKKIQAKLGHATPTMTMTRYVKQTPSMQDSMVKALKNF